MQINFYININQNLYIYLNYELKFIKYKSIFQRYSKFNFFRIIIVIIKYINVKF